MTEPLLCTCGQPATHNGLCHDCRVKATEAAAKKPKKKKSLDGKVKKG